MVEPSHRFQYVFERADGVSDISIERGRICVALDYLNTKSDLDAIKADTVAGEELEDAIVPRARLRAHLENREMVLLRGAPYAAMVYAIDYEVKNAHSSEHASVVERLVAISNLFPRGYLSQGRPVNRLSAIIAALTNQRITMRPSP